jgi:radical SAM superfamily enzyme YgiQ (UPF0313 family)
MNATSSEYCYIPMGAVGLVNQLAGAGWEVRGIDLPLEIGLDPFFSLEARVHDYLPLDLVLLDLDWYMTAAGVVDSARRVKRINPACQVVVGGMTATYFAEELLHRCREVDIVVRGDAEAALAAIAELLEHPSRGRLASVPNITFRESGRIRRSEHVSRTSSQEFDALDYVEIGWLDHVDAYFRTNIEGVRPDGPTNYWLAVGRGCFFNCTMCGGGLAAHRELFGLPRPMYRSVERTLDDLARIHARGVQQVAFSHDIFTLQYPDLDRLLAEVRRRRLDLGLYHEYWRLPKPEVVQAVYGAFDAASSDIAISPESGNEQVRRANFPSKRFSNADYLACLSELRNYAHGVEVFFAANLPWETTGTWEDSVELMDRIVDRFGNERLTAYAGFLTLDPMSPMWLEPERFEIVPQFRCLGDYLEMTESGRRTPGFLSAHLSPAGLVQNLSNFRQRMEARLYPAPEPTGQSGGQVTIAP